VSVEDIIASAEIMSKKSKIKLYKNISDDPGTPRMNWKLMNLGTSILAASQIEKISGIINTFSPARNKISLMRTLLREGIINFDVDAFFMSMCAVER
jgi:hypothetical protein